MKAIDTNVLVRFLVADDAVMHASASALFAAAGPDRKLFIPTLVLVEAVWVLQRRYQLDRGALADVISGLLEAGAVQLEAPELIQAGLSILQKGGDFSAGVITGAAHKGGATGLWTFDRRAARIDPAMQLID